MARTTIQSGNILGVLTDEHRERAAQLRSLAEGHAANGRGIEPGDFERLVVEVAAYVVGECVLVEPVIERVLGREGMLETRQMEARLLIRYLAHAGANLDSPPRFAEAMETVHAAYLDLTSRTEIEILTYLHYVLDTDERQRLATLYPAASEHAIAEYGQRRDSSAGRSWDDPHLLGALRKAFIEELERRGTLDWRSGPLLLGAPAKESVRSGRTHRGSRMRRRGRAAPSP